MFASGGDGADGENLFIWTAESYITPFDVLDEDPEVQYGFRIEEG